jgi:hypothetical protein
MEPGDELDDARGGLLLGGAVAALFFVVLGGVYLTEGLPGVAGIGTAALGLFYLSS